MNSELTIKFKDRTHYYNAQSGLHLISKTSAMISPEMDLEYFSREMENENIEQNKVDINENKEVNDSFISSPVTTIITNKKSYLYCLNCNKKGHNYRNCRFPINSYGCVHFKMCRDGKIRYLMIQKRHSHVYPEILRRKYYESFFDHKYLVQLIINLPETDRYYVINYDFDYLWTNYWKWIGNDEQSKYIHDEYKDCKAKFNLLKNGHVFPQYGFLSFATLFKKHPPLYMEPDWEFPKGKREEGETDQQCAIRECEEETRLIATNDYKLFLHVKPFQERYTSINHIQYCNSYYLAELTNYDKPLYYDPYQTKQNTEIRKIGWFTDVDICNLVNASSKYRLKMLNDISRLINNLKKN